MRRKKINEEKWQGWFHELDRYTTIERVTHAAGVLQYLSVGASFYP
jgi:hypothetical protein